MKTARLALVATIANLRPQTDPLSQTLIQVFAGNGELFFDGETDDEGILSVTAPAGRYSVLATYPGFQPITVDPVFVRPGYTNHLSVLFASCMVEEVACIGGLLSVAMKGTFVPLSLALTLNAYCNGFYAINHGEPLWGIWKIVTAPMDLIPFLHKVPAVADCAKAYIGSLINGTTTELPEMWGDIIDYWVISPRDDASRWINNQLYVNIIHPMRLQNAIYATPPDGSAPLATQNIDVPASLNLYDSEFNHTGEDPQGNVNWYIPRSSFYNINNIIQSASIAAVESTITLEFVGHRQDSLAIAIGISTPNGYTDRIFFDAIPVQPNSRAILRIEPDGTYGLLEFDSDGDGQNIVYIAPDLTVSPPQVPWAVYQEDHNDGQYIEWYLSESPNVEFYTVYRDTMYQYRQTPDRVLTTVDAQTNSYFDSTLAPAGRDFYYCVTATDSTGLESGIWGWANSNYGTGVGPRGPRKKQLLTIRSFPNPFNPDVTVEYTLTVASEISIGVYDVKGRLVKSLLRGSGTAGPHVLRWDGKDSFGQSVASGIYFCKIQADNASAVTKLVVLK